MFKILWYCASEESSHRIYQPICSGGFMKLQQRENNPLHTPDVYGLGLLGASFPYPGYEGTDLHTEYRKGLEERALSRSRTNGRPGDGEANE